MKTLKPELTLTEAQSWIEENAESLMFLNRNRTISVETIAQKISDEIQRGHIARRDLDIGGPIEVLNYVRELKQRIISMILNVFEKAESE